ncbi:MAG: DNA recombination protein RmuC [Actinomycetia bacterium]|nr:DNA recombination protein RmuC [Actinomycetes bacterium]
MTSFTLILTIALCAALLAIGATWWAMRLRAERDLAVVETERDLLRERVLDLEATVADDAQTAAALRPLGDALSRVERHVSDLERDRTSQFAALRTRMEQVQTAAGELGRATQTLAGSLNSANVRGAWGEVQLKRVLEEAGMLSRCDFDTQVSVTDSDGRQLRPDAVVRLPGDKVLVIDAKAPMTAFLQGQAEGLDTAEREQLLREHAASLAAHLKALAAKAYWSAFPTTPEMVVCFVPSEAMLAQALAADPSLHESALRSKVVLASPSSLFALVRTVAFTWQQDALTENARELLGLGQELYTRLSTLGSHVAAVGGSLSRSVDAYNKLVGTLEARVLVTARKLRDLELVTGDVDEPGAVEATPRQLTAVELLDVVAAEDDHRPELLLEPRRTRTQNRDVG